MSFNFGDFFAPPSVAKLIVLSVADGVAQVDQELGQASLGSGVVPQHIGECGIPKWFREALPQRLAGTVVITKPNITVSRSFSAQRRLSKPQEAANDMFQESHSLCLNQTNDHIAQDRPHRVEAFVGRADVAKPGVVEQNFLHNENCHGL